MTDPTATTEQPLADHDDLFPDRGTSTPWYRQPSVLFATAAIFIALGAIAIGGFFWNTGSTETVVAETTIAETEAPTTALEVTTTLAEPLADTTASTTAPTAPPTTTAAASTTAPTTTAPTVSVDPTTTAVTVPAATELTAWDLIKNSPDLSSFRQAIEDADLVKLFEDGKPITVFAPSNDAFVALQGGVGGQAVLDDPAQLRALVLHHVVSGALLSDALFAMSEVETENVDLLEIDANGPSIGGASILLADVAAGSSVLHVIDFVLLP